MNNIHIFLDSGAPTLFNTLAKKVSANEKKGAFKQMGQLLSKRHRDTYDWLDNEDYLSYRDRYIDYVKQNIDDLEVYSNLDIINNAEATWNNQKYLESKGLSPMPVWHFGTDESWLKRYLKEGYDYIGIGGLVPNPYLVIKPELDRIFSQLLCDKDGYPVVKVHGFAASSIRLIRRYPWYSVDGAGWIKTAALGDIFVPAKNNDGTLDYLHPLKISVAYNSPRRLQSGKHIESVVPSIRKYVLNYIEQKGFVFGEYVEEDGKRKVKMDGISTSPYHRCFFNAVFIQDFCSKLPEWPWAFKYKKMSLW